MLFGEHRLGIGADFVRHFPGSAKGPVAADNYKIDFASGEEQTGGIVRNDLVRDALLRQFPSRQCRALRTRPGFITEYVELFSPFLRLVHRRSGTADIHKRQPSGVAVGQDLHAGANQPRSVLANRPAMLHVVSGKILGSRQREGLLFRDTSSGQHSSPDLDHRVNRIHRGWTRGLERLEHTLDVAIETFYSAPAKRPRALRQTVSRSGTNGAGSADDHVGDRLRRSFIIARGHNFELVG